MSDLAEVKGLFSETQKTVEALRSDVDALKGKTADVIDEDRLSKMRDDLAAKFEAEQKASAARLEKLETAANRPAAAADGLSEDDRKAANLFDGYLRKGAAPDEFKAMATNTGEDGGFAVPTVLKDGIQNRLRRSTPIRAISNVVMLDGTSYDVLVERGQAGYEWAGETSSRSESDTPTINRISIALHELSALPKVSQRMLDLASFNVAAWLEERIGDRFARAEAAAFGAGDGVNKPKGFLSYDSATDADADRAAEKLQYRVTGASGAFNSTDPADVLIEVFYDLQAAYQANASWLMKNTTAAAVATLQDGQGAYLLQSMLNTDGAMVRTIQGRPMYLGDDMPAIAANSFSIAVGDFTAGYTIVDSSSIRILRDPFSAKPHVLFYATKRVGGGVTDFDAIKTVKFGTS